MKKVQPILPQLRGLLEDFLAFPAYQDLFKQFAEVIGYTGDDNQKIKNCLFVPNTDGELFFSVEGLYDLFLEFQLLKELIDKEPYKSLLIEYPESIQNIRNVVKKIYDKIDLTEEDLVLIFNTDKYDEARRLADSGTNLVEGN